MLDTYHVPEDIPACADGESPLYQPHRDINVDMEKIVEHLPCEYISLFYTGVKYTVRHVQSFCKG